MARSTIRAALLAAALAVGGCSFVTDNLFPSFEEPPAPPDDQPVVKRPAPSATPDASGPQGRQGRQQGRQPAQPQTFGTGASDAAAPEAAPDAAAATSVGARIEGIRGELAQLQGAIEAHNGRRRELRQQTEAHAREYHGTVGAINSRLHVGTTPGNPELVGQWTTAQGQLDVLSRDIAALSELANRVAADAATARYLLETTRAAYGLSGAVEEDHRRLAGLEDEVGRTASRIERLLHELLADIDRQSAYLGRERGNLTTISTAIKDGRLTAPALAARAPDRAPRAPAATRQPQGSAGGGAMAAPASGDRPLVVIRFDRDNVEYEQALYNAVSRALERQPQANFDVVAVAPKRGSAAETARGAERAQRNAEDVLRSLTSMGLPASRVSLSAGTSGQAQTAEVHLYVR